MALDRRSGELLAFIDGHQVVLLTQERRIKKNIRTTNGLTGRVKITHLELFSGSGEQFSLI
jgi:hypothetical protein